MLRKFSNNSGKWFLQPLLTNSSKLNQQQKYLEIHAINCWTVCCMTFTRACTDCTFCHTCAVWTVLSALNFALRIVPKVHAINAVVWLVSLMYLALIFVPVQTAQSAVRISEGCLDFCAAPCIGICAHSRVFLLSHFLNFLSLSPHWWWVFFICPLSLFYTCLL